MFLKTNTVLTLFSFKKCVTLLLKNLKLKPYLFYRIIWHTYSVYYRVNDSNNSNIRKLFSPNPAKDEIWVTKTDFIKGADNSVVREIRHKMSQKSLYHLNIFKNPKWKSFLPSKNPNCLGWNAKIKDNSNCGTLQTGSYYIVDFICCLCTVYCLYTVLKIIRISE